MPEIAQETPFPARAAAETLTTVLAAFRNDGADISWLYLIRAPFEYGMDEWVLRLVTEETSEAMWAKRVRLRHEGALPALPVEARLDVIKSDDLEAACIADYAKNAESWPIILDDFAWKGLYFDYVLVAGIEVRPLRPAPLRARSSKFIARRRKPFSPL